MEVIPLESLQTAGINTIENGEIIDMIKNSSNTVAVSDIPAYATKSKPLYSFIKRTFDIIFSTILLILSSPIWLITVLGIKISSPGPVFYIAHRVGKDAKVFDMLKFRSMHVDNHANEKSLRPDESRIFPFGRFIRATKIDELPQVVNVFLGQMSVVGPRPAAAEQVDITRGGKYIAIYAVKVGLTSPSALYDYIYGDDIADQAEYNVKVLPTRLDLDLYYLKKRGLGYDFKMIIYTVLCIFASIFHIEPKGIYKELVDAAKGVQESCTSSQSEIVKA